MEKIAVFVNDADHARRLIQPLLAGAGPTHWLLVACAPRLTRHIGRWVSQPARRQWLERWSRDLFAQLEPELRSVPSSQVERLVARQPLVELSRRLAARHGPIGLLDARRPQVGRVDEPISDWQPPSTRHRWVAPLAATGGLAVMLALAD